MAVNIAQYARHFDKNRAICLAREALGRKNRDRVVTEFSQERMFAACSEIFGVNRSSSGMQSRRRL
jgi:hypothetical protein